MKKCSNCGKSCEDNLFFCPYCGKFFDAAAPKPEKKPESEIHPEPEPEFEPESEPETDLPLPFENTSSSPTYSNSSEDHFLRNFFIGMGIFLLLVLILLT